MKSLSVNSFFLLFNILIMLKHTLSQQSNDQPLIPPNEAVVNIASIRIANQTEASESDVTVRRNVIMKIQPSMKPSPVTKIYKMILSPIRGILDAPKVNSVMRNIATCVVNGAVELISYYFPAPLIPIIASAAGMMIPFEPVLMLRDKMPVASYRRAFMTALNSFLGKFDKYKLSENDEYDPYMMQRFNRRMMKYGGSEKALNPSGPNIPKDNEQAGKENKPSFFAAIDKLFVTLDRLRSQDGGSESDDDPGRRFDWKRKKAGCPNC